MLRNYLKIAWVVFLRRKFFTFVSLFGITFTLTVLMVTAALLDHVFGRNVPEVQQHRSLTVLVAVISGRQGTSASALSWSVLDRTLGDLPGAEKVSITSMFSIATSFVEGARVESYFKTTDAAFWEILRFDFLEGRPYTHDEVEEGASVAVINRASRDRFFAGEPAVGRVLEVKDRRYRVVGVVENVPILRIVPFADIWVPYTTEPGHVDPARVLGTNMGLILARSRKDFETIRQEFSSRLADIDLTGEGDFDRLVAVPETIFQTVARMLLGGRERVVDRAPHLLTGVVILMLLFMVLPAINLVNLNISRILERAGEVGVRKAFGAPSLVLVGQFVVENVILTLAGGALALALAFVVLDAVSDAGWIPYAQFHLNLRIFVYALLTALVFGLVSGVYPAWRMSRLHPVDALRGTR